jgi:hypothetical protein
MSLLSMPSSLDGGGVDDPGARRAPDVLDRARESLVLAGRGPHAEVQVLAVDARRDDVEIDTQLAADVVDDALVRRRRQRQDRRRAERAVRGPDLEEGGAEVVAPLRYAVRLVDDQQIARVLLQQFEEGRVGEALRRGEHEVGLGFNARRLEARAWPAPRVGWSSS